MRRIGTLSNEHDARAFSDYLFTLQIDTQVERRNGEWDVWILDEDRLEQGRSELARFRAAPGDPRYSQAASQARQRRDEELRELLKAAQQRVNLRERWERPVWRQAPVTILLVAGSILVTLLCGFGRNDEMMSLLQIQRTSVEQLANGMAIVRWHSEFLHDVRQGEVWRLVTPIFIHMSPWHFLGNAWLTLVLGTAIERRRGSWRLLLGVLLIAVISNVAQYASDSPRFGGMSGVVYGLFGYVWLKGRFDPDADIAVSREATVLMLGWLLLCTTGLVGPIANVAHFSGLGVGLVVAGGEILVRRMRT